MSTPCTSPININSTDPSINECNVYCTYGYDYNDSVCVVSLNTTDPSGNYLDIKYDLKNSGTSHQVTFNGQSYNVTSLRLYQPSLHTYDGKQAPMELLIFHDGGVSDKLVVSIPYQSASGSANYTSSKVGSQILESIITDYSKFSLSSSSSSSSSSSNSQNLNITNFNLNSFIPNSKYYYYLGTELPKFGVCSQPKSTNYVLFDLSKGKQYISSDAISNLQNIIKNPSAFPITTNTLYISAKFPNSDSAAAKSDEIYIDCNPTGSEGEELYTPSDADNSASKVSSITNLLNGLKDSGVVQFIVSIILSIIIIWVIKRAFFTKRGASAGAGAGAGTSASVGGGVGETTP
jgi:carbonic anhydrase